MSGTFGDFLTALGKNESGNNYGFVSSLGYLGRYQFGEEALKAVGFYNGDDGTGAIDFVGSWTAKAASYGVFDKITFLASPAAQDAAAEAWFGKIDADINALGLGKWEGMTLNGVEITGSGLLAATHLVGVWAVKSFLESGGFANAWDGYGTPLTQYLTKFGGFDTPFGFNHDGADTLAGGTGADILRAGGGDDKVDGGAGFDIINGNTGSDTVSGGADGDWVLGGQQDDRVYGDDGADIVNGNLGNDTVDGGAGADYVRGGQGDDVLFGGADNDWLSGDLGADTMTGGAGADTFHFGQGSGADRILDFHAWEGDRIQLDPGTHYSASQVGADTVLDLGNGSSVTLTGVQLSSLGSGWIFEG